MSEKFKYDYSAPSIEERKEIESIRNQYLPKDESLTKLEKLKSLHAKVNNVPLIYGLTFGVVGLLIFGLGMTFVLEWSNLWYLAIPCAAVSVPLMAMAYPIYTKMTKKLKDRYSQEIIDLSNELLED